VNSRQVTLAGGDSTTVTLDVDTSDLPTGDHDVTVADGDGTSTTTMMVGEESTPTTTETTTEAPTTDVPTETTIEDDDEASGGGGGGSGSVGPGVSQDGGLGIRDVSVDRTRVTAGENVTVTLEVSNTDFVGHSRTFALEDGDRTLDERRVFVESDEKRTFTLTGTIDEAAEHELSVGGQSVTVTAEAADMSTSTAGPTTTVELTTTPQPTAETDGEPAQQHATETETESGGAADSTTDTDTTSGPVPGFGVVVSLVALLAAALLAYRRD